MNRYSKEIIAFTDEEIEKLNIGCLPSEGRYFTKECKKIKEGAFSVKIDAPKGEIYYHFFEPQNPQKIFLDVENLQEGAKSWHSIAKIGTSAFLPITFEFDPIFISKIDNVYWEIKVILNYEWANKIEICIENNNDEYSEEFELIYSHKGKKYYKCIMIEDRLSFSKFYFKITTNKSEIFYYGVDKKVIRNKPEEFYMSKEKLEQFKLSYDNYIDQGIVYHIFPDSFNIGKAFNKKKNIKYNDITNEAVWDRYYGGSLRGICEKVEYLKELGISTIYLTPIFASESPHRYDSINFLDIDEILGNKTDFQELIDICHKNNIKVILDIILNHCGVNFFAFKDLLINQEKSKYKDWFLIDKYPVDITSKEIMYSCWWNNKGMPQFNLHNKEVQRYLFESCSYWIKEFDIDGWRIDVSSELGISFIKKFCTYMRQIKSDITIIGENWKNGEMYLKGDTFNGITNYLLWWKAYVPFFIENSKSCEEFICEIMECYFSYSHISYCQCWNLISSHDLARFRNKLQDDKMFKILVLIQMLLPGTPIIYYGDEIGMNQGDDPKNRKYMEWDKCNDNNSIYKFYRSVLKVRNSTEIFKVGQLKIDLFNENEEVICFTRYFLNENVYIIINFSEIAVEIDTKKINKKEKTFFDLFEDRILNEDKFTLEPKMFVVLGERENRFGKV